MREVTCGDKEGFDNPHCCYYEYRGYGNGNVHVAEEDRAHLALVPKVGLCMHPNKDQRE